MTDVHQAAESIARCGLDLLASAEQLMHAEEPAAAHHVTFCPSCGYNLVADRPVIADGWMISPTDARYHGAPVALSPQQRIIFHTVAAAKGRTVSREALLNRSSDEECFPNIVNVHVCKIRAKLRQLAIPSPIETVWGCGFRWNATVENHS